MTVGFVVVSEVVVVASLVNVELSSETNKDGKCIYPSRKHVKVIHGLLRNRTRSSVAYGLRHFHRIRVWVTTRFLGVLQYRGLLRNTSIA